jgi:tRNA threonylcarbamoyladenosine biosynthesis protein TsaB
VIVLALETATPQVAVAVVGPGGVLACVGADRGMRHAERLVPFVQLALAEAGVSLGELGLVAVDVGPGLYTGLRVGVATANTLAQAAGLGVVGVSSLETLAATAVGFPGLVVPVVDARRSEVFSARYRWSDGRLAEVSGARLVRPEALAEELAGVDDEPVALVGDGALRYRSCFEACANALVWPSPLSRPDPGIMAGLALERARGVEGAPTPGEVQPVYLRDPDAVARFEPVVATEPVR